MLLGADDVDKDRQWAALFDALSHPTRIRILKALNAEPVGFADLKKKLGIDSSGHLQHHLSKLDGLITTNRFGKYTVSAQGRDALLSVATVERVAASGSDHQNTPSRIRRPNRVVAALVIVALLLIVSSVIAVVNHTRLAALTDQITTLQGQIGERDRAIDQLNQSVRWYERTFNLKQREPGYLTTLPTARTDGNATKIYLASAHVAYPRVLDLNVLGISVVIRNDYTAADADPTDPQAPIGTIASQYLSYIALTARLFDRDGRVILEISGLPIAVYSGNTASTGFTLHLALPEVDHYDLYVSDLSAPA